MAKAIACNLYVPPCKLCIPPDRLILPFFRRNPCAIVAAVLVRKAQRMAVPQAVEREPKTPQNLPKPHRIRARKQRIISHWRPKFPAGRT